MNQSRYGNTSMMSNNKNNQSTFAGTSDRMVKLTEKLNKISVNLLSLINYYTINN